MPSKNNRIDFVRIDILENWRFWNEYAKKGDFVGAGREVIAQANALLIQDSEANERAAMLIEEGLQFKRKKIEAGRKGGQESARSRRGVVPEQGTEPVEGTEPPRPTQRPAETPKNAEKIQPPRTRDEVYDFCQEQGIPEGYGIEWWNQNQPRDFHDKNGKPILNWKGALKRYYRAESNREK